jgi:hypothetical protein
MKSGERLTKSPSRGTASDEAIAANVRIEAVKETMMATRVRVDDCFTKRLTLSLYTFSIS